MFESLYQVLKNTTNEPKEKASSLPHLNWPADVSKTSSYNSPPPTPVQSPHKILPLEFSNIEQDARKAKGAPILMVTLFMY